MSAVIVTEEKKSYLNRPKAIGIKVRKPSFNPKNIRRHFLRILL